MIRYSGPMGTPQPARHTAIVTCMDARIDVLAVLGFALGDAHVIRNAGGVITDDVVRSLIISQRLLGTREIIVMHHTDCGMLTFTDDQLKAQIEAETGIRPPFAMEAFGDLDKDVVQSLARITASPFIPYKNRLRGFVYDVISSQIREIQPLVAA
ncbi:MAG TPA: carbonic anhydrase [Chloroflexota bacterium]|nr:carbonic anhydrase [Chloroflexota bacterium]